MAKQDSPGKVSDSDGTSKKDRSNKPRSLGQRLFLLAGNVWLLLTVLALIEVVLRIAGFMPGYIGANKDEYLDLKKVEHLEVIPLYITDSNGIYKANPDWRDWEPGAVVNQDGFRGRPFLCKGAGASTGDSIRLLLLGDSFTWGGNARPITYSFADLIGKAGFVTFNAGIPGTEPPQYKRIAEHYVDCLKPDIVCLFFFMGNDIMYHPLELKPHQQKYHITNAGWLNPFLDGEYIPTARGTYDYYMSKYTVPLQDESFPHWFLAQTSLGTMLYRVLARFQIMRTNPRVKARYDKLKQTIKDYPISYDYLVQTKQLVERAGARFMLFVIPDLDELKPNIEKDYPKLFRELDYFIPTDLVEDDYNPKPDGHLNNVGHGKYADFVLKTLKAETGGIR